MNKFILIGSDVHSDEQALSDLLAIAEDKNCLAFLYAGDLDIENPMIEIALKNLNCSFLPVLGNCDSPWMYSSIGLTNVPTYRNCQYNGLKINISHGHLYIPSEDAQVIITGHTHVPNLETDGKSVLLNPGSASRPRGNSCKSYAIIEFTEEGKALITIRKLDGQTVISGMEIIIQQ